MMVKGVAMAVKGVAMAVKGAHAAKVRVPCRLTA
jgi:hypothetical protein